MNIIKRAWLWLITKKESAVTDTTATDGTAVTPAATVETTPVVATDTTATTTTTTTTTVTSEADAVCERLRKLVVAAGAQAHVVIDDLIALAKKLG